MKNHFYISYAGNKRQEVKTIYDTIDFTNIKTIVEPFAGTSAMSFYISTQQKNLNYVLNDNNEYLYDMFNIIRDDDALSKFENKINNEILPLIKNNKESYNKYLKENKNIYGWFIANKFYAIRSGMYPQNGAFKNIDIKQCPIYEFYKNNNITFTKLDGIEIYEKYKSNKNNLILIDPPYLEACNDFYADSKVNIYEYFYNNKIEKEKAHVYLILEDIWIIKLLFDGFMKCQYDKTYETTKKKTKHVIYYNKK